MELSRADVERALEAVRLSEDRAREIIDERILSSLEERRFESLAADEASRLGSQAAAQERRFVTRSTLLTYGSAG